MISPERDEIDQTEAVCHADRRPSPRTIVNMKRIGCPVSFPALRSVRQAAGLYGDRAHIWFLPLFYVEFLRFVKGRLQLRSKPY